ncbi:phenylpropionate dioxygenase-like ring-hydroxylating dioxygenase large terminal subunit [Caulobacter ginsengisoli]|uniref:Phenylpropionate dioxygenase-like ring-hydroxylating dioxygenase large terminal subunit n=1 Tax=Caulobacter ginsengisoli TaxID=400775 RepID=A0ABU0IXQ6_9CAUL|nr:aromatic ring-hydroxylating dioxygenase subunit alpha [Caulobacter ginsengisoli]MDQ0466775.1 phenylpropionate dioxygenase-like ring-hydroxylating dioxygenase large terminal subunit [Caulobacter ginsengisoli]
MADPVRFPASTEAPRQDSDDWGLPGWIYHDEDFFRAEVQAVFRPSWQIVCHQNDIPNPGDFHTLDFLGENIVVVRGDDGLIRAFHNVCRHRASRVVDGPTGNCGLRMTCPYHAWSYDLRGRLAGVPLKRDFIDFDTERFGLAPVEAEVCLGFVFIRLEPGLPSVRDMLGEAYLAEMAHYRMEELQPLGRVTLRPRDVNWKNVSDNYSDSLHITVAHPGLTRLFGASYGLEAGDWVDKMWGVLREAPSDNWSERRYQAMLPDVDHLPAERRRLWTYFKLWPNIAFDIYPDQVDFMQFIPVSPTRTMLREIAYVLPDDRREMKAARYLNWRINRRVNIEDKDLIERVQAGMGSSSFTAGPLSRGEVALRSFARRMRGLIPQSRLDRAPPKGWA